MKMRGRVTALAALLLVPSSVALFAASPRKEWRKVVMKCAGSDLIKSNVLYTGPTARGALTVYKQIGGNYNPDRTVKDFADAGIDVSEAVLDSDPLSNCAATSDTKFSGSAKATVEGTGLQLAGNLGVAASRAKRVIVSINGFRWDWVKLGAVTDGLKEPKASSLRAALQEPGTFVALEALRVSGFQTTLEFDASVAAEVNPHYNTPSGVGLLATDGQVKAEWTSKRTLKMSSSAEAQPFVIAMVLGRYSPGGFTGVPGFVGEEAKLVRVESDLTSAVVVEKP